MGSTSDGFPEIRSNLTVSAWFKPQTPLGVGALVTRGVSAQEAYTLFVGDSDVRAILNWESPDRFDPFVKVPPFSGDTFYHVALVYDFDHGKVSIYLDGQRMGLFDYSPPLYQQTEPLYLGVSFPGRLEVFRGVLDDVRIYNRALNGGEILELFNGGTRLTIEVSEVRLCWNSVTNGTYQLQYRSEFTTNLWTNLGTSMSGNGTTNCMTDTVLGRERRFYRVLLLSE
jgi:hypothetical protein